MSRKGIMLCYPFEEKRLLSWPKPWFVQPKLDGDRLRAVFDMEGKVTLLSSEENEKPFFKEIIEELEAMNLHGVEFDGEAYIHGLPHEEIHGMLGRTVNRHEDSADMKFHIFDTVLDKMPQFERLQIVQRLFGTRKFKHIEYVPFKPVVELDDLYREYDKYIENGYEGFVVRHPWAYYFRKRSTSIMKFKPKKQDAYQIIGYKEEVDIHGVPKNRLGALICTSNDGSGGTFSVGSGLTDEQRVNLWTVRDALAGLWASVKYQHITSTGKVPRHPVFVEILDKAPEDMNIYKVEL